jgi:serine phosphatase RsbU (regulator of sigma subunit)
MTGFVFLTVLPAVVNFGLGVYVWSRNSEARENRLLALACFGLSIYCFRFFEVYTRPLEFAEVVFPALTFGPLFAGAFLSDFLLTIARRPLLPRRRLENLLIYGPVTLFAAGNVFTDWFFGGIEVSASGVYVPLPGPLSDLSFGFLGLLLLTAIIKVLKSLIGSTDVNQKKQLLWSISGIIVGIVTTVVVLKLPSQLYVLVPELGLISVAFSTTLIAGTMVYAIARYGLAPSIEELRRREEQLRREKAEALAREAELERQILDAQVREERRRQDELEAELQMAHQMQMRLMPEESPCIESLTVAGRCLPASHVGGDYFQYFQRDGKLAFCLADVTGHDMQAAIPVVMFSGILESQMELGWPLDELVNRLNRSLHRVLDKRTFVCFAMGELTIAQRTLNITNAGCPYPFYFSAAAGLVKELQIAAYPLGVNSSCSCQIEEATMEPGDIVVLCSDGIIEAANHSGDIYGCERTSELIRQCGRRGVEADAIIEEILAEVQAFVGSAPVEDDMTCVVVKVT